LSYLLHKNDILTIYCCRTCA